MKFNKSIFDKNILDLIQQKINEYKIDDYYDNEYNLIISINPKDCLYLEEVSFSYYRSWINFDNELEKIELAVRIAISYLDYELYDRLFHINQIFFETKNNIEHTQIELVKVGFHNINAKKKEPLKIHLNILLDNTNIFKIVDLLNYFEDEFYIDERNNNKISFNSLLLKKEQGNKLKIENLNEQEWKQLILKEKITNKELANLYGILEKDLIKVRHKYIPTIKQFEDEYFIYYIIFNNMKLNDYYSNFSIPLLEYMKNHNIKIMYEYLNPNYNEIINIDEELKRQKEVETNNLMGNEYIMPLSGVLLKKFYWAIKNHQLDRKILKNSWFKTYYGPMFLDSFIEQIEESGILELYETGKIYESEFFIPYQELYKKLNIKESEQTDNQSLTKVENMDSMQHQKKKRRKIVPPRDHINLAKIKSKVGRIGEELVYKYEKETLKDYPNLQKKIKKVYLTNENAGYDIESYDFNGDKIYIEVKTNKTNSNNRIKFFISQGEDEFISKHENAYIYYIYDLDNPKLRVIDQKTYLSYYKKVTNYEIDQDIIKQ